MENANRTLFPGSVVVLHGGWTAFAPPPDERLAFRPEYRVKKNKSEIP
jgi:hypothetical protein